MLGGHGPAVGLHDTDGHGHQDGADVGRDRADGDLEDDKELVGHAPHRHEHPGAQALELADELRAGLLQAVALQGAGEDHQDQGNELGAVGDEGAPHRLQQLREGDLSAHRSDGCGDKDDRDRLQLQCEADDHDQDAE